MALPAPELSVVVAVVSGFEPALQCVRSIEKDAGQVAVQIIVVQSGFFDFGTAVTIVDAPPGCSEDAMRIIGRSAANGDKVAVVGDRYTVQPGWIRAAVSGKGDNISGCIDAPSQLSAAGWAIYLAEYSHVLLPAAAALMGNIVYRDAASHPRQEPGLRVTFAHPQRLGEYAAQRFHWSRSWAQEQSRNWSPSRRAIGAVTRVALPVLLLWRRSRNVLSTRRYRRKLLGALPYLLVFGVIEAAGEISGFLFDRNRSECNPRY